MKLRSLLTIILLWSLGVGLIRFAAWQFNHDAAFQMNPTHREMTKGYVEDIRTLPSLVRWDGFYYTNIAAHGYGDQNPMAEFVRGFFPLYPYLTRYLNRLLPIDIFQTALLLSHLAFLAALLLLARLGKTREESDLLTEVSPAVAALAVPTAFIFSAAYTEALFLAMTLLTFSLAKDKNFWLAAIVAIGTAWVRIHSIPFFFCLMALAWYDKDEPGYQRWLPPIGMLIGFASLLLFYQITCNDPFAYLAGQKLIAPQLQISFRAFTEFPDRLIPGLTHLGFGKLYFLLELPVLLLMLLSAGWCMRERRAPEAIFIIATIVLSMLSGSFWALPRFAFALFPVLLYLGSLQRHLVLFATLIAIGIALQTVLLNNFVNYWWPAL